VNNTSGNWAYLLILSIGAVIICLTHSLTVRGIIVTVILIALTWSTYNNWARDVAPKYDAEVWKKFDEDKTKP